MLDWVSSSVIFAALGGALGGLAGGLLSSALKDEKLRSFGRFAAIVLVIVGARVAEPLLRPVIGDQIDAIAPASRAIENAVDEAFVSVETMLDKDPMFIALVEREPGLKEELKQGITAIAVAYAYDTDEVRRRSFAFGAELTQSRLEHYLARAQDDDLVAWFTGANRIVRHLLETDPGFCHVYFYGGSQLSGYDLPEIRRRIGEGLFNAQQELSAAVIRNAHNDIPEFDADSARLILGGAGQLLFQSFSDEARALMVMETKAPNDEAAAQACEATAVLFDFVLDGQMPADVLRFMVSPQE